MKIVKFNSLTFLLELHLAIYNLFLYLKDLCNKEIDCLSKIIEKNFKKNKNGACLVLWFHTSLNDKFEFKK